MKQIEANNAMLNGLIPESSPFSGALITDDTASSQPSFGEKF